MTLKKGLDLQVTGDVAMGRLKMLCLYCPQILLDESTTYGDGVETTPGVVAWSRPVACKGSFI
jgi:hypothetical protein